MKQLLPIWWPKNPPIYDIKKSYVENLEQGPFFKASIPEREVFSKAKWKNFLGFPVASLLGVPAGPLLNSRWVSFAAQMGFDIVTYKTIRSKSHSAHPLPNMIYVDTKGALTADRLQETLIQTSTPPPNLTQLAATNSFGIPSQSREFLIKDIDKANRSLAPGQVMIVSVVGTPRPGEDFIQDFVICSQIAIDGGAKIIEVDLSCPNVTTREGSLFTNPEVIFTLCSRMKQVIKSTPLIIKVGVIQQHETLRQVMHAAAKGGAEAICGINTVSMKVTKPDGQPALEKTRLKAGVCGGPIRQMALDFIRLASQLNHKEKFSLTIMGTGGITLPEHFDQFFQTGADVAMSAVGMMWDPYLAARYHSWK